MRKLILSLVIGMAAVSSAQAGKLVCWTDDRGQKSCGDRVPPQYATKERQVLDSQGRVIGKQERQKTPQEIAAAEAKLAAEAAEKERYEMQEKYDRFLLQSFTSAKDLESSRDARLRALQSQITLSDKANAEGEKSLKGLRDRVAAAKKAGKPADPKLEKQIKEFETSLAEGRKAREQRVKDQAEITAKFGADIERFNALKTGKVQIGGILAPPAAPPPAPN